jgi:hypothetical protein
MEEEKIKIDLSRSNKNSNPRWKKRMRCLNVRFDKIYVGEQECSSAKIFDRGTNNLDAGLN